MLGIILVPGAGFLWAALLGATWGPLFSLTMALPLDVGHGPAEVADLATANPTADLGQLAVGQTITIDASQLGQSTPAVPP